MLAMASTTNRFHCTANTATPTPLITMSCRHMSGHNGDQSAYAHEDRVITYNDYDARRAWSNEAPRITGVKAPAGRSPARGG
eukprot:jgi/Chrzof1/4800/UNPLg00804.t1